jgi:hypothetical protein
MKIYLVVSEKNRWVFLSPTAEASRTDTGANERRPWYWRKLEAFYQNVRRALENAQSGLLLKMQLAIKRLESEIDPSEGMMKRMRQTKKIELVHPARFREHLVKRRFFRFLRRRTMYHTRWLLINLMLLPVSSLMMILPGPNVFFGWNAFRLISHHLAREGGKRVLSERCRLDLVPASEADIGATLREKIGTRTELQPSKS